jgi:hypothetical protein
VCGPAFVNRAFKNGVADVANSLSVPKYTKDPGIYAEDYEEEVWERLGGVYELASGTAANELACIQTMMMLFQTFQEALKLCPPLPTTKLYDIRSIGFDHASSNTGEKNGLGKQLEDARYESFIADGGNPSLYKPLWTIGCMDHKQALMEKEISSRFAALLIQWGFPQLCSSAKVPSHHVLAIAKRIMST